MDVQSKIPKPGQGGDSRRTRNILGGLLVFAVLWLASSIILSIQGVFDQPQEPPVYFGLFLGGSITALLLAYAISQSFRRAVLAVPLWAIVAVHGLRLVGIFFILDAINGVLPNQFGWPAGVGDIVAGIASIPLAFMLWRGMRSRRLRNVFIAWSIFGLIDLFLAVSLGLLYSESVVGFLSQPGLDSQALTHMPLSIIPTFYVPILILLHFLALRRIREVDSR